MNAESNRLTNVLLLVVVTLILLNLAVPFTRSEPPALPAPAAPAADRHDHEIADLVAKIDLLVRAAPVRAAAAQAEPIGDEIVIRIPGELAREWGLTAEDVRTVVEGLARVAKTAGVRRKAAGETAAIATARNICSAQAQFQAAAKADTDRDGTGEFGSFRELSGAAAIRGLEQVGRLNPPVLSGAFRNPSAAGFVSRSGYYFAIYLPDGGGDGVIPDASGYGHVDPDRAETTWCMYAWPVNYGVTGRRTFMMNQTGDVIATDAKDYTGTNAPLPGAAFLEGGRYHIAGRLANGTTGQDGNAWVQVN